ncbi:hypothetical protein GA0061071_107257 [Kosakonia oryzendophytica]|uniref:2OG-Fe(II) oxygenase superfamily protein n=1 Tax=Kosakonia oryzendophytica TaxID=1005665 RepID=A0A1C4CI21_9ENTR|nr:2OG-Fe(II) oxygenase [Kosakonia oryzendophytica]TDT59346.1 hypothetical protein DFO53_0920 [Enterobacter sp. AG5470]SCC18694.1 hypothetical protein GA0061071_107257 [Kosakonia oryzendophytica]
MMNTSELTGINNSLNAFKDTLSEQEREHYKLLLSLACGGLLGKSDKQGIENLALKATLQSLAELQPHHDRVTVNGIAWRGRPDFLSEELFLALNKESRDVYPLSQRFDDHLVSSGGVVARQVAFSEQLIDLVKKYAGNVIPTGKTNYLYYNEEGMGIDPHIDNAEFPMNVIMMLDHQSDSSPSALVLYPTDQDPVRIYLKPGELIILFADSILHSRERMKENEEVRIVAFGFQPV